MTDRPLSQFYTEDSFGRALSETQALSIVTSINPEIEFNTSVLSQLEVSAYAAFQDALGGEGLEGFLRSERFDSSEHQSLGPVWKSAYDPLSALLDTPRESRFSNETFLFFCSVALASEKPNAASQVLKKYDLDWSVESDSWETTTLKSVGVALLSLVRQSNISDIELSKNQINTLAKQQRSSEKPWLDAQSSRKAFSLMALYHIAQAVLKTSEYLAGC